MSFSAAFVASNEALGLYHFSINQRVVEIWIDDYEREDKIEVLPWGKVYPSKKSLSISDIQKVLKSYEPLMVLFNGSYPLSTKWVIELGKELKSRGILTGIGIDCHRFSASSLLDLFDYKLFKLYNVSKLNSNIALLNLEKCLSFLNGIKHAELHIYVTSNEEIRILELVQKVRKDIPIHIYDFINGEKKYLAMLKGDFINKYYHSNEKRESYHITKCPKCQSIVITRLNNRPRKVFLSGNHCKYCNEEVLMVAPSKKYEASWILSRDKVFIPWLSGVITM